MQYWEPENDYFEVDENFDFNTGINKLLESEVEKRLSQKVEGYEEAIERDTESRKTIAELKSEIRNMEQDLIEVEKTFRKKGADEKARELLGGFKLGDEVWFVLNKHTRKECDTCFGKRKVPAQVAGEIMDIECPKCRGYGSKSITNQSAEKGRVKEIKIHTWAEGHRLDVDMYIEPTSYRDSDSVSRSLGSAFKTKEECESSFEK